jgi:hypothetical protein
MQQALRQEIERNFPGADPDEILKDLPSPSELRATSDEGHLRILRAIVQLSEGDRTRLAKMADAAREDWRDVLYWAEYPQDPGAPRSFEELKEQLGLKDRDP